MVIGIPKETEPDENRVSIVPDTARRLAQKGFEVVVEAGAGRSCGSSDNSYEQAGARVAASAWDADVVVTVNPIPEADVSRLRQGAWIVGFLYPGKNRDLVRTLAINRITSVAVDMIPRTTLAQSMDALSSQSNIAGYKAAVIAAFRLPKIFPMLMTAAGTVPPAKVLVVGAGVAGLQAIATARRLGAVVEAFDVRRAAKEQVESLGAKFVMVDEIEDAETEGGYAKESSENYRRRQSELLQKHLAKSDVCITTALVPGKKAPVLITESMVKGMVPGSVIVDLAAPMGGNCELTEPRRDVERHGVTIVGHTNLPGTVAAHASRLYSGNIEKLLLHLTGGKPELPAIDLEDEIARSCVITHNGAIAHANFQEAT